MNRWQARGMVKELPEPATAANPTDTSAGNFKYKSRDFAKGGKKAKFTANLAAIKTLQSIKAEGRTAATPEEQEALSKYVGWGQFPELFGYDPAWSKERETLQATMSSDEWDAAKKSILNAHYTDPSVVEAHWKMAEKLGFKGGRFLETSAGIGYYLGMMPPELAGKTKSSAVELDDLTGGILQLLYPEANVKVEGFQDYQAPEGFYDLVASNVPFGDYKVHDPKYNKHRASIHDYFFLKSVDLASSEFFLSHTSYSRLAGLNSASSFSNSSRSICSLMAFPLNVVPGV